MCRLCDVDPAGRSHNVVEGLARANMTDNKAPSAAGGAASVSGGAPASSRRVDVMLGSTACRFRRGHRLRLQVCSAAHPRWLRNLGRLAETGADLSQFAAADAVVAHQQLFHGEGEAGSTLSLPCMEPNVLDACVAPAQVC